MLPYYLVKIFGNRNCHVHEVSKTIWQEGLKSIFLPAILPNVHRYKKFFTGRLSNKFVKKYGY